MTQPTLFDVNPSGLTEMAQTKLRVRASDPPTSKTAARRSGAFASKHGQKIANILRVVGKPLTCHEISDLSPTLAHAQIHKRMKELETAGFIVRCPTRPCRCNHTDPSTCDGRPMQTWKAL